MKQSVPATNFFFVPADEQQELEDMRVMLKLSSGRRAFRRFLSAVNVIGSSMVMVNNEVKITEYNEGLRAVGIWLATKIETADPGAVARLMLESSNDRQAKNAKTRRKEDV